MKASHLVLHRITAVTDQSVQFPHTMSLDTKQLNYFTQTQQTFTRHMHQPTGMNSIDVQVNSAYSSTQTSDDSMMESGVNEPSTVPVDTSQSAKDSEAHSGSRRPDKASDLSHCPNIDAVKIHIECFLGIDDTNASTNHIQQLLSWSLPQDDWDWVRSMIQQLASIGSFVKNLSLTQRPSRGILGVLANVIASAFELIVSGMTETPVMLSLISKEFVQLIINHDQFHIALAGFFPIEMAE